MLPESNYVCQPQQNPKPTTIFLGCVGDAANKLGHT